MTLREKIEEILKQYATSLFKANFLYDLMASGKTITNEDRKNFRDEEAKKFTTAILSAIEESLPKEEPNLSSPPLHDYEDGEIAGFNGCLNQIKALLKEGKS